MIQKQENVGPCTREDLACTGPVENLNIAYRLFLSSNGLGPLGIEEERDRSPDGSFAVDEYPGKTRESKD